MSARTLTQTCKRCGSQFTIALPSLEEDPYRFAERLMLNKTHCDPCCDLAAKERQQAEAEERARERRAQWETICPPIYRDTDKSKLPRLGALAEVMRWGYGPRGLILHGPTGLGKSRCAWLLLEREFIAGRTAKILNATAALRYSAMFSSSCESALRWVDDMSMCKILFADDVFKCRMTDSFEQALFAIIETRTANKLPIVATTNDTGESLEARMSEDRGGALIRRLREFCDGVTFK